MNATQQLTAAVNNAFPFEVEKYSLNGPTGSPSGHFGLFRSDNGECIGNAVKEGYTPHTRDDVLAMGEAAVSVLTADEDIPLAISARWTGNGHALVIGPTHDFHMEAAENDLIFPRFNLTAGYGSTMFRASGGLYRHACTNLMEMRPVGENMSAHIRHTKALRAGMPEMITQFGRIAATWDAQVQQARDLESKAVEFRPFLLEVMPLDTEATDRTKTAWENRFDSMIGRILEDRLIRKVDPADPRICTAWEAHNAVQGFVQHQQRRRGRHDRLDRALLSLESPLVERSLEAALAV